MSSTQWAQPEDLLIVVAGRTLQLEGDFFSWSGVLSFAYSCSCCTVPWCCVWWHPALGLTCRPRSWSSSVAFQPQHWWLPPACFLAWTSHTSGLSLAAKPNCLWTPCHHLQVICILVLVPVFLQLWNSSDMGKPEVFSTIHMTPTLLLWWVVKPKLGVPSFSFFGHSPWFLGCHEMELSLGLHSYFSITII